MNYKNKSLLGLECKSDKIIKSKAIKFIVKKYYFIVTMETYFTSFKKNTANENSSVIKTKNRLMLLSSCPICGKRNQLSLRIKK